MIYALLDKLISISKKEATAIKAAKQLFKFGIIGFLNTWLTYVIYLLLIKATNATFAMAIGYGVTSLIGLTLNNRWVFNAHAQFKSVVMKYYVTYLFTWIISVGFANAASSWSQMNTTLIPLFSLILTVPTNFLLSKFWVFHRQKLKEVRQNGNQP